MERQKNRPMWGLFAVLLVIFLNGMVCEFVLKKIYWEQTLLSSIPKEYFLHAILSCFGEESSALWMIPIHILHWMKYAPTRGIVLYALRWLPYLCVFLLPVFSALMKKRELPLVICAVTAGICAIGIVLVKYLANLKSLNLFIAVPFAIETVVLILACIALGTKKKGFSMMKKKT